MKYLSVCSGIEAASVAWHPLGWKPLAFSEIEAFPRAVLAHHYPDTPLYGDFTNLRDEPLIGDADVLVGGTPCQAFSVAGLRKSLDDDRGNLSLEFVRLADAIDNLRRDRGRSPSIIVWENVPGVLSVKDNAFGCFLAGLAGDVTPYDPPRGKWTDAGVVAGPERAVAWRILDAQYFGLAQRRRRVFVVASARDGFDPAAVLLEWEGMRRDTPPSREAGQVAPTIPARSTGGGGLGTDFDLDGGVIQTPEVVGTLDTECGGGKLTHSLRVEAFAASEDGTGRGTPLVPVAFSSKDHGADATADLSPTLRAMPHNESHPNGGGQMAVAYPLDLRNAGRDPDKMDAVNRQGLGIGEDGDPSPTISTAFVPGVAAYGFQPRIARNGRGDMGEIVNALNAQSGETGKGDAAPCVAVGFQSNAGSHGGDIFSEMSPTLRVQKSGGGGMPAVAQQHMAVRRLTPVECERLQGFPDGYTMIPWKKKPADQCPDGPRYKALGNSMAVPVMRWVGNRIKEALS